MSEFGTSLQWLCFQSLHIFEDVEFHFHYKSGNREGVKFAKRSLTDFQIL